jgi:hypothetical protein
VVRKTTNLEGEMSYQEPGGYRIIDVAALNLPAPHSRVGCHKCGHENGYLSRYLKGNGATTIRWVCANCENYTTCGDLPYWLLLEYKVGIKELPLRVNRVEDDGIECVVCNVPAVEFHHWAPRAIFPDWPDAGVYLCQHHHDEWHIRMRAHGLRWPHELVDAT